MFEDFKNAFETLRGFVEWAKSLPAQLTSIFPNYIILAFGTFFIVLVVLLLIKLVKGLASLVSGILSGFIA